MSENDFNSAILESEVIVTHIADGHLYHFPILANGTVSLHGVRTEENPKARRDPRRYLFDAHNAARSAFARSQV
jgi:hypothetical protein